MAPKLYKKMSLKIPRFVPFGANLTEFEASSASRGTGREVRTTVCVFAYWPAPPLDIPNNTPSACSSRHSTHYTTGIPLRYSCNQTNDKLVVVVGEAGVTDTDKPPPKDGRFGSKVGQIGPKWDKSGTFSDQISVYLAPPPNPPCSTSMVV